MEAREITFVSRGVGLIKGAHSKWASLQGRWWYVTGLAILSIIVTGPRQWLSDRLDDMSALLELPDHWWGQWLIVFAGFICIGIGVWRSFRSTHEVKALEKASATRLAAQEGSFQHRIAAARIEGATAGFVQASFIPQKMAEHYSFHRDIVLLDDAIIEMGHRIRDYKRRCARWLGEESFKIDHVMKQSDLTADFLSLTREGRFLHFTPPPFRGRAPMDLLYLIRMDHSDFSQYDPAANAAFRDALTRYIAAIDSYHGTLLAFRNKQSAALNKMAEELQKASMQ
jgi:hypothetical protein